MAIPKLPPLQVPQVPSSTPKEPPKSNFTFFLMTIVFMLIMMRMMSKPQEEPVVPDPVSVEDASPEPVLSEEAVNKIAPELVDSAQKESEPVYVTLGSADPKSPYRLLATLTNRGAAVSRIELNEKAYNDTQDKTGYLGQIVVDEPASMRGVPEPGGVQVQVVGDGTPAYFAGLKKGDLIVAIDLNIGNEPAKVTSFDVLRNELLKTKPGQTIKLGVVRAGNWTPNAVVSETAESQIPNTSSVVDAEQDDGSVPPVDTTTASAPSTVVDWTPEWVEVRLSDTPVSIIRPSSLIKSYNDYENNRGLQGSVYHYNDAGELESDLRSQERKLNGDQLSFLMTLGSYDKEKEVFWVDKPVARRGNLPRPQNLPELTNVELRDSYWDYLPEKSNETTTVFRKVLLSRQMEIIKTYSLVPGEAADAKGRKEENASEYHLTLKLEFRNLDTDNAHKFTYLLDGPTGLPTEGAWYSRGAYGLRDLVVLLNGRSFHVIRANDIAEGKTASSSEQIGLDFLGVDSQYFLCTMIPQHLKTEERLNCFYTPIRVGARAQENPAFSNISFRIKSTEQELAPGGTNGDTFTQEYTIFAGPKKPDILENYHLEKTIVYGWFWFVAIPLLAILHFFKTYLVFNYGLAIILLTILVRLCLFPLSIKQVISSQKMQKIQPELNALKEQYKDRPQEMMQAQQALFRKHNVHPLSGCLPIFIQLPIFIGLYKALSLDVSLYGAPLFSEHFRWCSNLAAPDMLINWSSFWNSIGWPGFNMSGTGFLSMFSLGPYFNLLPMVTIILFLVQQKFLMPPVVGNDEAAQQQRMMRRMMTFMMIFMGFMFFKVPSGLCVYFIVSSLWGILERKFHTKFAKPEKEKVSVAVNSAFQTAGGVYTTGSRKKQAQSLQNKKADKPAPGSIRAWWNDIVKKAQQQQKLVKAEYEKRERQKKNRKR